MKQSVMMRDPQSVADILKHAARWHGERPVVSRAADGASRLTYTTLETRARQIASALDIIAAGGVVATLAMNTHRHLEVYYGVAGAGRLCHTVNPRLAVAQIAQVVRAGGADTMFADPAFLSLAIQIARETGTLRTIVVLGDLPAGAAETTVALLGYETLLARGEPAGWPAVDEDAAAMLCYTSGTTGHPKGVAYSHRSILLHAYATALPDALSLSARDVICPAVPMFHVNAWGIPFSAPLVGASLVMPGADLTGRALYDLFEAEGVTFALGVPTIWNGFLDFLRAEAQRPSMLNRICIGGSALSTAMARTFEEEYGICVLHAWGMTETSPVGTVNSRPLSAPLPEGGSVNQGRPLFGIDLRLVGEGGSMQPHDGTARGELQVRGPWVAGRYHGSDAPSDAFTPDAWFRTGDIATIDTDGSLTIVDRVKDLIKSGGEWISSVELENAACAYPGVIEAAAISIPDPRWHERPLLLLVTRDSQVSKADLQAHLAGRLARFAVPDRIEIVTDLPRGATGKIDKMALRALYGS